MEGPLSRYARYGPMLLAEHEPASERVSVHSPPDEQEKLCRIVELLDMGPFYCEKVSDNHLDFFVRNNIEFSFRHGFRVYGPIVVHRQYLDLWDAQEIVDHLERQMLGAVRHWRREVIEALE